MAAATCKASEVAQATSAAAAGLAPGQATDLRRGVGGYAGGVVPDRVPLLGRQVQIRMTGRGPLRGPPLPQLGPTQIRREFPAAVPDRAAVLGCVALQRDRVPGDLTRVLDAEPLPHQHPGLVQTGEELVLAVRRCGGGGDLPPQRDTGSLVEAAAGGLLVLRAGRTASRSAVGGRGRPQSVALLGSQAGGADLVPFPRQAGLAAVLPRQHRHDMDVVVAVPDGDPADGFVFLPVGRQAGAVHDLMRYLGPLIVAEHPVFGGGAHRAVPYRPGIPVPVHGCLRLQQQPVQPGEVAPAVSPQRGFQRGRMTPASDYMGIRMLFLTAGTEQVIQQGLDVLPARGADLPDHLAAFAFLAEVMTRSCARRRLPRRCGRRGASCSAA